MSIHEIRNYVLAALLGFAALTLLPACSSTEEAPPPEPTSTESTGTTDSGGSMADKCAQCADGDVSCKENYCL